MDTPSPTGPDRVIRLARFFSYPKQVIYLLISFLALISLVHFFSLAQKYIRARHARSKPAWYSRVPYAIVDSLRAVLFRWTIPVPFGYSLNIAEVGLTLGYLAVLLTWTFVNTTTVTGIKVEPHYYANRAGTIAASQLPLVTALGMRNNLVSYLTGVSYDKLNYLHRIAFRSLVIIIWIHAGGRMTVGLLDDEALTSRWVQCGLLAAITLVVMSILTLRPLRKLSYEVFLVIHFVFALIFLLSVYFHLTGRDLTYYGAWPAMIVWGVDRFIRLLKLALFNLPTFLSRSSSSSSTNALVEILPSLSTSTSKESKSTKDQNHHPTPSEALAETFLKITVTIPDTPLKGLMNWRPGQSVYLSIPSLTWWPFQAHPFTIANIHQGSHSGSVEGDIEKASGNRNSEAQSGFGKDVSLVFFVRVRQGFTRRLYDVVRSSGSQNPAKMMNVVLNGPYSAPPVLVGYERVVMIAGGSGIAFTLPLLLDLIAKSHNPKATGCKRVLFIWAVRDAAQLSWITPLLHPVLSSLSSSGTSGTSAFSSSTLEIDIRFYITSSVTSSSPSSGAITPPTPSSTHEKHSGEHDADIEGLGDLPVLPSTSPSSSNDEYNHNTTLASFNSDFVNLQTRDGRPDIEGLVRGEINDLDEGGGQGEGGVVSVNVCGPTALIDATRRAIRVPRPLEVLKGAPRVVLHVEAFGGA
ncbi:ferric reductase NAD binding domain-containing protein [Panaeolus papilionaceus]|nr:ferric reductase NAD binding domain-containing protein [Panaeolus papilionaceus]